MKMANNVTYNLVPIIGKADLDDEAEQFLKKYYPEALQNTNGCTYHEHC